MRLSPTLEQLAARAAAGDQAVLIMGERGVGKETLARRIHELSGRASKPFVGINCGGLSDSLFDSEVFSHGELPGLMESANGGTFLISEVGELSLRSQADLMRVLMNRQFSLDGYGSAQ